ncbi:hypothetical protein K1T71_007530, partial [Dendrolimus kikuchii]
PSRRTTKSRSGTRGCGRGAVLRFPRKDTTETRTDALLKEVQAELQQGQAARAETARFLRNSVDDEDDIVEVE